LAQFKPVLAMNPDILDRYAANRLRVVRQLRYSLHNENGVVVTIKSESASKSNELAAAWSGGKKIVVCTIQTFPFAMKAVQELAATQGKRFAVIADEAHSS
jgi:type I restriction enzyme R subunit